METSEKLAQAAITKEKIKCPRPGAHSANCQIKDIWDIVDDVDLFVACKGTRWVKVCDGCGGAGWNGKMNKVCDTCAGTGCVMAIES